MKGFFAMVAWVLVWGCIIFLATSCGSTFPPLTSPKDKHQYENHR